MNSYVTHTAILVNSIDSVAKFFLERRFHLNEPETFEGEGTREIYIGDNNQNSSTILLVEPAGEGPYKAALKKRGSGIHHVGVNVENLVEYCTGLGRFGWLLHTHSLKSVPKLQTAYLVRPGVPLMLEVHERSMAARMPSLLTEIGLAGALKYLPMVESIRPENVQITQSKTEEIVFETIGGSFSLKEILAYDRKSE